MLCPVVLLLTEADVGGADVVNSSFGASAKTSDPFWVRSGA